MRGIYYSNTGLNAVQYKINTVAGNLANINTNGYKQQNASFSTFMEVLWPLDQDTSTILSHGVAPDITTIDMRSGTIIETRRNLDFAIDGEGYFKLQTPDGIRYSRSGSFFSDRLSYLVDSEGNKVLSESGPIRIVNGKPDKAFQIVSFREKQYVEKSGENLFSAAPEAQVYTLQEAKVKSGFIETANVDIIAGINDLLASIRWFQMNSRVLSVQDELLKKSTEEVGSLK